MPNSLDDAVITNVLSSINVPSTKVIPVNGAQITIPRPFPSPIEWRDLWIYQILIDRFNNPSALPIGWDTQTFGFQGGTFNGIRSQLGYLQNLGVGAIWLSPVLKNVAMSNHYHGYGIQDFLEAEPQFGSGLNPADQELIQLIDEAHARGMYVIFDIVINHAGDVFEYNGHGSKANWSEQPYGISWRNGGVANPAWPTAPAAPPSNASVWPTELRNNDYFRRRGMRNPNNELEGDFDILKELVTDYQNNTGRFPVREALIRVYQYLIAKFDIDGFRIDTIKYVEPEFSQVFANAIREYALSIGKKNFFIFGEIWDLEEKIAQFIGRNTEKDGDLIGIDAALDFPVFSCLTSVTKGLSTPMELAQVYEKRKKVQKKILTTHGEASKYFVTFLDNHDQFERYYYSHPTSPNQFDNQVTMAIAILMSLQGIPCIYYGTEQGLCSTVDRYINDNAKNVERVREALWGKPGAFNVGSTHQFYNELQNISRVRAQNPALRFGRQYFRQVSNIVGTVFSVAETKPGILSFSRILNDKEVVIVVNCTGGVWDGEVLIDSRLNSSKSVFRLLYSNQPAVAIASGTVIFKPFVTVIELDNNAHNGSINVLQVHLEPYEAQILGN